jgi:hypothetical protein
MKLRLDDRHGRTLVVAEVARRRVEDYPGQHTAGWAFWIRQLSGCDVIQDGLVEHVYLYEGTVRIAATTARVLQAQGMNRPFDLKQGKPFFVQALPVLSAWLLDAAPETQRAEGKYRTPRGQRTETCPCGAHYTDCWIHDDWLTCA